MIQFDKLIYFSNGLKPPTRFRNGDIPASDLLVYQILFRIQMGLASPTGLYMGIRRTFWDRGDDTMFDAFVHLGHKQLGVAA